MHKNPIEFLLCKSSVPEECILCCKIFTYAFALYLVIENIDECIFFSLICVKIYQTHPDCLLPLVLLLFLAHAPAQSAVAGRTGVSHRLHAVHAAGDDAARHTPDDAKHESNDPGRGAWLGGSPGCDVLLALRAHKGGRITPVRGGCHILDLGYHLWLPLHGL